MRSLLMFASIFVCASVANPIIRENAHPGSPRTEWDVNGAGDPDIQGFATKFSVLPGDEVVLKIKTKSDLYRVDVYRLGYYQGHGARLVLQTTPFVALPQVQPECNYIGQTRSVDCANWAPSVKFRLAANATSGAYIARLVRMDNIPPRVHGATWRTDASQVKKEVKFARPGEDERPSDPEERPHAYGERMRSDGVLSDDELREPRSSLVYFVVKSNTPTSVLFQTADTTAQAYNNYPLENRGSSTYGSYDPTRPRARAFAGSYNRPFATRGYRTINFIFGAEFPAIRFLERNGYDVSYQVLFQLIQFSSSLPLFSPPSSSDVISSSSEWI